MRIPAKEALMNHWKTQGIITDSRVLDAFVKVPREQFVRQGMEKHAYDDHALPIGEGQTISQPSTVMIMTQALEVDAGMKVLEVGTGSGYQAALLSILAGEQGKVYTTEMISSLYETAKEKLATYANITMLNVDGAQGLKRYAPFDRIIVTAASQKIPQPLIDQLKEDGLIVAPIGSPYEQAMIVGRKKGKELLTKSFGSFAFVPLTGEFGFK
mgnify:CR=1 FL=1